MPTASPIITTISVTKKTNGNCWPMTATAANAVTMETMASPNGSSVATTAPNSSSSTSRAIGTPKRSPRSKSCVASSLFS